MWIECDTYIGPCRRGGKKLRLLDRRHGDSGERTPSVAALLRQLRANAMDLSDPNHRRRFKLRLTATIQLAHRSQQNAVAMELTRLDNAMTATAGATGACATREGNGSSIFVNPTMRIKASGPTLQKKP